MRFCLYLVLGTAVLGTLSAASRPAPEAPAAIGNSPIAQAFWMVKVDARTGKLVRTLVGPRPSFSDKAAPDVHALVAEAAKNFDVNPLLVDSMIQVESNYNPFAVSQKGARGLMQLMPATAQRFGATDSFDPKQNIEAGVRYLKFLQNTFQDERLAIAAYNAGEGAVAKYKDVPPYPETVSYVAKVAKKYGQAKGVTKSEAKNAEEPKAVEERAEDAPRHILSYVDSEGKLHIQTR
jgi:soluble lytic murein transglycosylase-like protein